MSAPPIKLSRARESRTAIERIYVIMRHLFNRGSYKPMGVSGEGLKRELMVLRPEIYGSITDPEKVELDGLLYVIERLPRGIEECRFVKLISKEGFDQSNFKPLVPVKRKRNCYRIDKDHMYIEMTRGRSDIYDILTHLTFIYIEAEKICNNALDQKNRLKREWELLEEIVLKESHGKKFNMEVAFTYLSILLGRTYEETFHTSRKFKQAENANSLFHITYWLGKRSMEERLNQRDREITFSAALRDRIGHHIYGEQWANNIKSFLSRKGLLKRPLHVISANPHSVMNTLYGYAALKRSHSYKNLSEMAGELSKVKNEKLRAQVRRFALKNGMTEIDDTFGTNITIQLFDTAHFKTSWFSGHNEIDFHKKENKKDSAVLMVMDYAFGEQAYETLDELLKPYENKKEPVPINVKSISIMGKAGILEGYKGDIMIPTAFVFEGTADNYPINNSIRYFDFTKYKLNVYKGPMITVLGTSLQNKDVLRYFKESSWKAIGLEMEGAHYQKAIQAATRIRKSIMSDIKLRYAYYASDNPLKTGHTLASGSLGLEGIKPTYTITRIILNDIFRNS